MDLSDQWVREGCVPDNPLLSYERAAVDKVLQLRRQRRAPTAQSADPNAHREPK